MPHHELAECMAGMCIALKSEDQADMRKKQELWDRRLAYTARKLCADDNNTTMMDQDNAQLSEAILEEKVAELLKKINTLGLSDSFTDNMVKMTHEFISWSDTNEEDVERLMMCGLLIKSVSTLTHLKKLRHHPQAFMMDPN
jgi:hypothetical protein